MRRDMRKDMIRNYRPEEINNLLEETHWKHNYEDRHEMKEMEIPLSQFIPQTE